MTQQTATHQPDILDVIGDLSSDEVFTPPRIANAILDLLPEEVWTDPDLRWLDPGCKTGVFPREITKRLLVGLAAAIPNEDERLEHILCNMVYGIAITELTSLMSRRSLYCSKDASGDKSVVQMPTSRGNVWFERVEHDYDDRGRCSECGASKSQMERGGKENYAYAFIHKGGLESVAEELNMKFDVIVGNPPYQMSSEGNSRTMPLYNLFVDQARDLHPRYIAMIIPSRWMVTGLGLKAFRESMLSDRRIRTLVDYPNAAEVFPTVDIKSGVGYFLWDRDNPGPCEITLTRDHEAHGPIARELNEYDVLVRDNRGLEILRKVQKLAEPSLVEILSADKEFGLTSNFKGYSKKAKRGWVRLYAYKGDGEPVGWVNREDIPKSAHLIDTYKVMIPKAGPGNSGGHVIPDMVLGRPFVGKNPSVSTQTYLFFWVGSEPEAESLASYLRTRFARFLISLRKISQDATRSTYTWVPQQTWDRTWTDQELYDKYDIRESEQAYITEMIREMPT